VEMTIADKEKMPLYTKAVRGIAPFSSGHSRAVEHTDAVAPP